MDAKKRIIDLTLGEFLDAIGERMEVSAQKPEKPKSAKRYVYGLKGLAGKSSVSCPLKPSDSAPLKHSTMPP